MGSPARSLKPRKSKLYHGSRKILCMVTKARSWIFENKSGKQMTVAIVSHFLRGCGINPSFAQKQQQCELARFAVHDHGVSSANSSHASLSPYSLR